MIQILYILEEYNDYIKYNNIVYKNTTDDIIKRILINIKSYYEELKVPVIDWSDFETYFFVKNPMITPSKAIQFKAVFDTIKKPNAALKSSLLDTYMERYHAERIAFMALEVAEGKPSKRLDVVQSELDEYILQSGKAAQIGKEANREDITTILNRTSSSAGLRWRLTGLNESLGSLIKGKFLFFGGRPDSGKTTLLMSEGGYMAQQLPEDEICFYFSNEEDADALKPRILCSVLGIDLLTLKSDPDMYWERYKDALGGNPDKILLIEKPDLSVTDIEWWIAHEKPGLILVDQLRKVKGFDTLDGIKRTERLFNWGREIAKHHAPVITVGQLDDSAENEAYPPMRTIYESKTAIQGEMDVIVNIGCVAGSVPPNARYLGVVKNKMPSPEVPALRKGKHEVLILQDIGRFV